MSTQPTNGPPMPDPGASNEDPKAIAFKPQIKSRLPIHIAKHKQTAVARFRYARGHENGLKYLGLRVGWLALFWLVTFVAVAMLDLKLLWELLIGYLAMPVATQIKAEDGDLSFPDVTICPKAPFSSQASVEDQAELELLRTNVKKKLVDANLQLTPENIQAAVLIELATQEGKNIPRGFEHLIFCRFNDEQCSFVNFTEIVHLRYVQCFTFTPQQRNIGAGRGLTFIYFTQEHGKPFMLLNDLEDSMFKQDIHDGINVFLHNPLTFPTFEISHMPTSFPVSYGHAAHLEVSGLQYTSDKSGRKNCIGKIDPYRYKNYRGSAQFLEYDYTFEDCVTNKKQELIYAQCGCYSDELFVPYTSGNETQQNEPTSATKGSEFCRDIRGQTSQRIHAQFLCHERLVKMATTSVLDEFISPDKFYETRNDPDTRKLLRHEVCAMSCHKMIYDTKRFEISQLDSEYSVKMSSLGDYLEELNRNKLMNPSLQDPLSTLLPAHDLIIVDIRLVHDRVDTWQEELTSSLFNLMANVGGTLGLCTGTSFISGFFLILFFGASLIHAIVAFVLWFWWAVFQGRPPPKGGRAAMVKYKPLEYWEKDDRGYSWEPRKMRSVRRETQRRSVVTKAELSKQNRTSRGPSIPIQKAFKNDVQKDAKRVNTDHVELNNELSNLIPQTFGEEAISSYDSRENKNPNQIPTIKFSNLAPESLGNQEAVTPDATVQQENVEPHMWVMPWQPGEMLKKKQKKIQPKPEPSPNPSIENTSNSLHVVENNLKYETKPGQDTDAMKNAPVTNKKGEFSPKMKTLPSEPAVSLSRYSQLHPIDVQFKVKVVGKVRAERLRKTSDEAMRSRDQSTLSPFRRLTGTNHRPSMLSERLKQLNSGLFDKKVGQETYRKDLMQATKKPMNIRHNILNRQSTANSGQHSDRTVKPRQWRSKRRFSPTILHQMEIAGDRLSRRPIDPSSAVEKGLMRALPTTLESPLFLLPQSTHAEVEEFARQQKRLHKMQIARQV